MNIERVNAELSKQITKIIKQEIKDPRFADLGIITIMKVEATKDLDLCKVYVSFYNSNKSSKEAISILQSTSNFIKTTLYGRIKIRKVPNIVFILDESLDYASKIEDLLKLAKEKDGGNK